MTDNYAKIVKNNLDSLYQNLPDDLADRLPGEQKGNHFIFEAFGEACQITPENIFLDGAPQTRVMGILISLYALHVQPEPCQPEPFKAFKDFPSSMPYIGAFATHTEGILVPHVENIRENSEKIMEKLRGQNALADTGGDISFIVYPFPKVALYYIFYMADEEFPASATCLFSSNALTFLPIDALADTGEYTSKKILSLL